MDRRVALKQLALFTGGLIVIPSCDFSEENILAAYEKLQVTEDHKKLLTKVVATILPGGEIKGAEELNIQDFVLVMANDCLSEENQSDFVNGLKHFDNYVKKKYNSSFGKMDQSKAEEVFNTIVNNEEEVIKQDGLDITELKYFLETTKRFTLQGYLSTEYFMTEIMPYKMIPGGFQGEKLIDPSEKINING
jgi:hypothetical protein